MEVERRKYTCNTAAETREWIAAIVDFIEPYKFFFQANVVNFIKERLWEAVDEDWIDCLAHDPVEHLLHIPCGIVQDHWPASLKEYVLTARSLAFPREQEKLEKVLPGITTGSLNNVLSQGMNPKKKHEVEILSSLVSCISRDTGAGTVVDVGAGQGYLSQVLAFHYQLPVVAVDASSHHGVVTNRRAEGIKKHYTSLHNSGSVKSLPNMPETVTCRVLSSCMLRELNNYCCRKDKSDETELTGKSYDDSCDASPVIRDHSLQSGSDNADSESSLVLAGLHACGDLSVTMLRAFVECSEVKALVSIGCCYNLLSEDGCDDASPGVGFPVSKWAKSIGISLGKNARDLACQSAERWRDLEKDAGAQNFDLHAFRAAFQMVLHQYYPEVLLRSPSVGRQGKALRRQQKTASTVPLELAESGADVLTKTILETDTSRAGSSQSNCSGRLVDKFGLFEKFSHSALHKLGLGPLQDMNLPELWRKCQPFAGLIGPYWSLRAALGPLLETLILLDRLLFLQEQESALEVVMLPVFDPVLSPRNLAIIARKISS